MSMLSPEEIKHSALLARVGLKEEEIARYREDLSSVLDFFAELKQVDVQNIATLDAGSGRENSAREDRVREASPEEKNLPLKNAPEMKDGYVKVKSVF